MEIQPLKTASSRRPILRPWPRRNVLCQQWTQGLLSNLDRFIREDARSSQSARAKRYAVRILLLQAEKSGFTETKRITPAWLASTPAQTARREGRTLLGRLLVKAALWSQDNYELLIENLAASAAESKPKSTHEANPPMPLCEVVVALAYRCGLSTREMQALRIGDVELAGLRIRPPHPMKGQLREGEVSRGHTSPGRFIPFGTGWDEIPKQLLDVYVESERPIDYLFFSRSPRDKHKPISRNTLEAGVARPHGGDTIRSLRNRHFQEDFNRARDLRALRFHLRNFHGLSNVYVHQLICGVPARGMGFVVSAASFPIPQPYLVAAICASGVLPKSSSVRVGATERSSARWTGLLGRYSITVDWPTDFVKELQGRGRKRDRALRVLYRAAWNQWYSSRLMKSPHIGTGTRDDRELLEGFAKTYVEVQDTEKSDTWSGSLFEFRNRRRTTYVPLIEAMNGAVWRNQCKICMHPRRAEIDCEIRQALGIDGRVKGLKQIARSFKVPYQPLMRHAGMKPPVPGRGETSRTHLGSASPASVIWCQKLLTERAEQLTVDACIIFPLIAQARGQGQTSVSLSESTVAETVGATMNLNRLSLALAKLRSEHLISDFSRLPSGFQVELATTN